MNVIQSYQGVVSSAFQHLNHRVSEKGERNGNVLIAASIDDECTIIVSASSDLSDNG